MGAGRLVVGFAAALWVFGGGWVIESLWRWVTGSGSVFGVLGAFWPTGGPAPFGERLVGAWVEASSSPVWWLQMLVLGLWSFPALGLAGVVIARPVALSFGASRSLGLRASWAFALRRWRSVLVFAMAPVVAASLLAAVLWAYGLVFFTSGVMSVVGAGLYVAPLLLGLGVTLTLGVFVAAAPMMPAAVAVENTDGVDAIQRSFAYVLDRTIRFAVYVAVLGVVLVASYEVIQLVLRSARDVAVNVGGAPRIGLEVAAGEERPSATESASLWLFNAWLQVMWLAFIGWVVSYVFSAGTMLYLVMRRVVDAQDEREVWIGE